MSDGMERRAAGYVEMDERNPHLYGLAIVYDELSEDLGGFREVIDRGAFGEWLAGEHDIRAVWGHETRYVLGRTANGTLLLEETESGVSVTIDPPKTQWARDLMESIRRGDISQMSFGFRAVDERWEERNGELIRHVVRGELYEVSPVAFPAYPATSVAVEARERARAMRARGRADGEGTTGQGAASDADGWRGSRGRLTLLRRKLRIEEEV